MKKNKERKIIIDKTDWFIGKDSKVIGLITENKRTYSFITKIDTTTKILRNFILYFKIKLLQSSKGEHKPLHNKRK